MNQTASVSFFHRLLMACIPLAAGLVRLAGHTLRVKLIDPHGLAPQARQGGPYIYAFWHNQQLMAMHFFSNFGIRVLVSRSRDGDYIARALESFGFATVRASASSGQLNALRGLARGLAAGKHAAITPDGPRGPMYCAQPGPVFLAMLTGRMIAPFACAAKRSWRLRSWDQFEIPKPFSRAAIVYGEPIQVPGKMDQIQIQGWVKKLETRLNELRQEACRALEPRP